MHKYIDKEIVDPVLQALSTANTNFAPAHSSIHKSTRSLLPGVSFQRSRRYQMEKEIVYLKAERQRIYHHVVLGAILRFWKRFVNPSLPISANKE
jgi:hypothetical protein